jgi:hypothetical protein
MLGLNADVLLYRSSQASKEHWFCLVFFFFIFGFVFFFFFHDIDQNNISPASKSKERAVKIGPISIQRRRYRRRHDSMQRLRHKNSCIHNYNTVGKKKRSCVCVCASESVFYIIAGCCVRSLADSTRRYLRLRYTTTSIARGYFAWKKRKNLIASQAEFRKSFSFFFKKTLSSSS